MRRLATAIGILVLATATTAGAQQPASPGDVHHPGGQTQAPAAGRQPQQPGHRGGGTMPMMDMCREMMGGHATMGPGMMAGGQPGDPKAMAQVMEMRGDMMKAMGEVMLKHAKKLQEAPAK
ncbi:MAG TPA: hypothetical protein VFV05_06355 [Methylomirabilota bacterium]|nr:hypothetical protein [Methylomirabilota bacterium]